MKKILDRLDTVHRQLLEAVEPLDAASFARRPLPDQWSVAEIVHHLCLVEQYVIKGLERGLARPPQTMGVLYRLIPYSLLVGRRVYRIRAPRFVEPLNPPSKEAVIENYKRSRATLKTISDERGRKRLGGVVLTHPVFGKLDGIKAVAFVGYHEQRHFKQIQEIIEKIK